MMVSLGKPVVSILQQKWVGGLAAVAPDLYSFSTQRKTMRIHRRRHTSRPTERLGKATRNGHTARMTPDAVMKHLKVAEEICHEVHGKWDCNLIEQRDDLSYRCKFPCPRCGKEARETMTRVITGKKIEDDKWLLHWSSKCRHVTGTDELVACVAVPVEENGVEVGVIEPVSPPEWPRYEVSRNGRTNYDLPCAWFGTLWQATHASLQNSRMLAQVQKITEPNKSESWEVAPSRKRQRFQ